MRLRSDGTVSLPIPVVKLVHANPLFEDSKRDHSKCKYQRPVFQMSAHCLLGIAESQVWMKPSVNDRAGHIQNVIRSAAFQVNVLGRERRIVDDMDMVARQGP